ncbi:MAG: cytochrome c3 family protein, partial [Myxococcales bacterium]
MALFKPWTNTAARLSLAVLAGVGGLGIGGLFAWHRSPLGREMNEPLEQPVQFDHRHHVNDVGIDCRYCHSTVETSPRAGIPTTQLCMGCHGQIWNKSPLLSPVREAFFADRPLAWRRVHKVPDFVYFNHSIHVQKGVGCETCHGRVDQMAA